MTGRDIDTAGRLATPRSSASAAARIIGRVMLVGATNAALSLLATLARAGFDVMVASTAAQALRDLNSQSADLVVVIGDPEDMSAHEFTRALRSTSDIGLVLLDDNSQLADRIIALELGADDYVHAGIEPLELLARIRTILRRVRRTLMTPVGQTFRFNGWALDTRSRRLTDASGNDVHLTAREFEVLELLLKRANQVVPRDDLQGSSPAGHESRAIDALVGRVRRKLGDDIHSRAIRPVRNSGYVLTLAVEVCA